MSPGQRTACVNQGAHLTSLAKPLGSVGLAAFECEALKLL
jgi:hypothetical protein